MQTRSSLLHFCLSLLVPTMHPVQQSSAFPVVADLRNLDAAALQHPIVHVQGLSGELADLDAVE